MAEPDFWNDQEKAQKLISDNNLLKEKRDSFLKLQQGYEDETTALELLREEPDPDLHQEVETDLKNLQEAFHNYELDLLLSGKYDSHNALLEIHPGAGDREYHCGTLPLPAGLRGKGDRRDLRHPHRAGRPAGLLQL